MRPNAAEGLSLDQYSGVIAVDANQRRLSVLQMLLGPAMELGKEFLQGKAEEKKAIQQRKINQINNDADWESKMAEASANSWKDEYLTIVLTLPIIAVGYSIVTGDQSVIDRLNDGFLALERLPEWYQYLLFLACSSAFAVKGADKIMNLRKKK